MGLVLLLFLLNAVSAQRNVSSPAKSQLRSWAAQHPEAVEAVSSSGSPVADLETTLTAGPSGPILLEDYTLLDQLQAFDRERIPERVVHARGTGAHGDLEVTSDISRYSMAQVFATVPSTTRVLVRFSKVTGERGSPESTRDIRGFAVKFYTSEGIWDLVVNSAPVFFVRDPLRFMSLVHALNRNPQSNLRDPSMMWDYLSLVPETTFLLLFQYSDLGIPDGYRHINGFSISTFTLVNATGYRTLARFHFRTLQGLRNLSEAEGLRLAATDPDYFTRDLYNAIGEGNYPRWRFYIQPMTFQQAENLSFNPLDPTKLWPESEFPLVEVGTLTLSRNPENFFTEIEMAAFSPRRLVPGIETTTDKILQSRLFAYVDTQTYRLGTNYLLELTNRPVNLGMYYNYQRDGYARCDDNEGSAVNYYPNSFNGPQVSPRGLTTSYPVNGTVGRYNTLQDDNFSQPRQFWNSLTPGEQGRLVASLAASLSGAYLPIQRRAVANFRQVSPQLGQMLSSNLGLDDATVTTASPPLQ